MKISMLEPLAVPNSTIMELAKPLIDSGDIFEICDKPLTDEEKIKRAKDADVVIIANGYLAPAVVSKSEKLKLITVGFTGVDHIDEKTCKEKKVTVCNAQGYATEATAELTVALMLNVLRNIVPCHAATIAGGDKTGLVGNELNGKIVGIIGTGAIGGRVAEILSIFGCKLIGYNSSQHDKMKDLGLKYVELEEIFKQSDIVTLHVPLLDSTKNLVNKKNIDLMKKSAILINCARGPLVDFDALVEALNNDKIAGAGLDVFDIEPPLPKDHLITKAKNLIVTPHVAYATSESMVKRAKIVFDNIIAWKDGKPTNVKY